MRSGSIAAGLAAAALLASCAEGAREISLADARAAVTQIARSPAEALCKAAGREALRQAVRDYTAALDREGRPFQPVRRGYGLSAEGVAMYGLIVGDVKVNDFKGEARETAQRVLAVANEFEHTRALRAMHRVACPQTVAYLQGAARQQAARDGSERRIAQALERGDHRRAAQLRQRLDRRERLAERSESAFAREIEWLLGS